MFSLTLLVVHSSLSLSSQLKLKTVKQEQKPGKKSRNFGER